MKTLEAIVTSLEVSKKLDVALKKANIKVEPLFWWIRFTDCPDGSKHWILKDYKLIGGIDHIPALITSEIGEVIYNEHHIGHIKYHEIRKAYLEVMDIEERFFIPEQMMLNAMEQPDIGADMLCYLIDNQLLKK